MKTFILNIACILLLSISFFSCAQDEDFFDEENFGNFKDVNKSYTTIENEIFYLVNEHRENLGLNKLMIINLISIEAEVHTDYMIGTGVPSHDNFPIRRKKLIENINAELVGENIAYGYRTASAVVKSWIQSPSHKRIIENPKYSHFGISTKKNNKDKNFFTHIFITMN